MLDQTELQALKTQIANRAVEYHFYELNVDRVQAWEKFFDTYLQNAQCAVEDGDERPAAQAHAVKLKEALEVAHALFMEQLTCILTKELPDYVVAEIRKNFGKPESDKIAFWLGDLDPNGIRMDYYDVSDMVNFSVRLDSELRPVLLDDEDEG